MRLFVVVSGTNLWKPCSEAHLQQGPKCLRQRLVRPAQHGLGVGVRATEAHQHRVPGPSPHHRPRTVLAHRCHSTACQNQYLRRFKGQFHWFYFHQRNLRYLMMKNSKTKLPPPNATVCSIYPMCPATGKLCPPAGRDGRWTYGFDQKKVSSDQGRSLDKGSEKRLEDPRDPPQKRPNVSVRQVALKIFGNSWQFIALKKPKMPFWTIVGQFDNLLRARPKIWPNLQKVSSVQGGGRWTLGEGYFLKATPLPKREALVCVGSNFSAFLRSSSPSAGPAPN